MSKKSYPSELQDRFIVRLPDGMRDQLKEEAERNGRSMNAEIVARLQGTLPPPVVGQMLMDLEHVRPKDGGDLEAAQRAVRQSELLHEISEHLQAVESKVASLQKLSHLTIEAAAIKLTPRARAENKRD